MNLTNRVQLIGVAVSNPVTRRFESGAVVSRFTLRTDDTFKVGGQIRHDVQWHNIVAWGRDAEYVESKVSTDSEVVIDGRITQRAYLDRQGVKQFICEIVVQTIICQAASRAKAVGATA